MNRDDTAARAVLWHRVRGHRAALRQWDALGRPTRLLGAALATVAALRECLYVLAAIDGADAQEQAEAEQEVREWTPH